MVAPVALAVPAGLLCSKLPDSVRTPLLEGYITPVLNTVMGMIVAVSGPMVFFYLLWGVTAIGDVQMNLTGLADSLGMLDHKVLQQKNNQCSDKHQPVKSVCSSCQH